MSNSRGHTAIQDSENLVDRYKGNRSLSDLNRKQLVTEIQRELGILHESHSSGNMDQNFSKIGLKAVLKELRDQ